MDETFSNVTLSADQLRTMTDAQIRKALGLNPRGPNPFSMRETLLRDHWGTKQILDDAANALFNQLEAA